MAASTKALSLPVLGRLLGVVAVVAVVEVVDFMAAAGAVFETKALVVNVVPDFDETGVQLAPT